jgi:imidazolonepropionase-like amidohydrolase
MLIDAHVHIALGGIQPKHQWKQLSLEKKTELIKGIIQQYKSHNIFAVRDGGDALFISKLAREIAAAENFIYKSPIYALFKKGCYGSFLGRPVDDVDSFKDEFKILLKHKPDQLKIILTGIVNFSKYGDVGKTAFSERELKYMADSAKFSGLPVMVHANGVEGVNTAIRCRVDTVEHGYLMSERELHGMAENNIIWIPTLAPLGNILVSNDQAFINEMDTIRKVYNRQVENIIKAHEIGVKIALGSDSGAYRVGHGSGLLDEIVHFEKIGFSRRQIEHMCYENGLKALQKERTC